MPERGAMEELKKKIEKLARENGLDPELALLALDPEKTVPPELMQTLTAILDKVGLYDEALRRLDKE